MDATLAIIFAITSLTDMALNDCKTGCLAPQSDTARLSFQASAVEFQSKIIGSELYLGYDSTQAYGPYQITYGAAITEDMDTWVGMGLKWTSKRIDTGPWFVETSLMPGLHFVADGPDLGGNLQFRSALGLGYEFDNGTTLLVSYDHRSNADTQPKNPGLETIAIRYAISWN
jgi:hypothetical protein